MIFHSCSDQGPYFQTGQRVRLNHAVHGCVIGQVNAIARVGRSVFKFEVVTPYGTEIVDVDQLVAADNVVAFPRPDTAPCELEPSA